MSEGEISTFLRKKEPGSCMEPIAVTGIREPLPTTMKEGAGYHEKEEWESKLRVRGHV